MFRRESPKGTFCMCCEKDATIDVYLFGDDLEDAVRRYDPDLRLCEAHLKEVIALLSHSVAYRTLEQQIQELWASRGLEVTKEIFQAIGKDEFKWTIIARTPKATEDKYPESGN